MSVQEALELWAELSGTLDQVRDKIGEPADEFTDSVEYTGSRIAETIQKYNRCSDKQMGALQNMLEGAQKWLK